MIIKAIGAQPKKEPSLFPCIMQENSTLRFALFLDRNKGIWLTDASVLGCNVGGEKINKDSEIFKAWRRMDAGFTISLIQE